jgi:hypothetical protein
VQVLAGRPQGGAGAGKRLTEDPETRPEGAVECDRYPFDAALDPGVVAPRGVQQDAVQRHDDGDGDDPANTTWVTKWRPNTTRNDSTAVPKMTAPPSAKGRSCGGARLAGATTQNAWLASPDTKEQFRLQVSLGRHQG